MLASFKQLLYRVPTCGSLFSSLNTKNKFVVNETLYLFKLIIQALPLHTFYSLFELNLKLFDRNIIIRLLKIVEINVAIVKRRKKNYSKV